MLRKILVASVIAATAAMGGLIASPDRAEAGVTVKIGQDRHHHGRHHRRCVTETKVVKKTFLRHGARVVKTVRKPVTRCR